MSRRLSLLIVVLALSAVVQAGKQNHGVGRLGGAHSNDGPRHEQGHGEGKRLPKPSVKEQHPNQAELEAGGQGSGQKDEELNDKPAHHEGERRRQEGQRHHEEHRREDFRADEHHDGRSARVGQPVRRARGNATHVQKNTARMGPQSRTGPQARALGPLPVRQPVQRRNVSRAHPPSGYHGQQQARRSNASRLNNPTRKESTPKTGTLHPRAGRPQLIHLANASRHQNPASTTIVGRKGNATRRGPRPRTGAQAQSGTGNLPAGAKPRSWLRQGPRPRSNVKNAGRNQHEAKQPHRFRIDNRHNLAHKAISVQTSVDSSPTVDSGRHHGDHEGNKTGSDKTSYVVVASVGSVVVAIVGFAAFKMYKAKRHLASSFKPYQTFSNADDDMIMY